MNTTTQQQHQETAGPKPVQPTEEPKPELLWSVEQAAKFVQEKVQYSLENAAGDDGKIQAAQHRGDLAPRHLLLWRSK